LSIQSDGEISLGSLIFPRDDGHRPSPLRLGGRRSDLRSGPATL